MRTKNTNKNCTRSGWSRDGQDEGWKVNLTSPTVRWWQHRAQIQLHGWVFKEWWEVPNLTRAVLEGIRIVVIGEGKGPEDMRLTPDIWMTGSSSCGILGGTIFVRVYAKGNTWSWEAYSLHNQQGLSYLNTALLFHIAETPESCISTQFQEESHNSQGEFPCLEWIQCRGWMVTCLGCGMGDSGNRKAGGFSWIT